MPVPNRILLVCFGNLCRSPMAHGLMRHLLPADWEVTSAGTHAFGGTPPTATAQEAVLAETGIDISRLRSQRLTLELIESAAHVFTMSIQQARVCITLAPAAAERVRLFGSFAPAASVSTRCSADPGGEAATAVEIADPMGGTHDEYVHCLRRLERAAAACTAWLIDGADRTKAPPALADSN